MANEQNSNSAPGGTSNTTKIILGVIIVGLAASTAYFAFQTQQLKQQNVEYAENKVELETEISQLNDKITQMGSDIENKDIQLEEKNRRIEQMSAELDNARKRLAQLSAAGRLTASQLEEYKGKVDQMAYYIEKYQAEIARLKEENERLTGQVTNLTQEVRQRDSTITEAQRENTLYRTKLQAAAILEAAEFSFAEVNRRGKESAANKDRELRLSTDEKLKITFTLMKNAVAEIGSRTLYAVIKGPDGTVYKSFEATGGYFTFNGQEVPYSTKTAVNYDRASQSVSMLYALPQGTEWKEGQTTVVIYCEGYEIGTATLKLK